MNKFEDVDVIASLEAIMKQNTAFYQNDFDLDRNILQKAAASPTAEDRRLLWFSRPSGTSCFRERDVFLKGTRQHNTWRFYGEQTRDKVLAYAVELTGIVNGKIKGNLYELDYPQHFRHVKEQALTEHKLKKDLQTWVLPFVLNIRKVARRNKHFVAYFLAALFSLCPRCFYRFSKSLEVIFFYWSFCHNYSPSYIVLFLFSLGYVYIIHSSSLNNS